MKSLLWFPLSSAAAESARAQSNGFTPQGRTVSRHEGERERNCVMVCVLCFMPCEFSPSIQGCRHHWFLWPRDFHANVHCGGSPYCEIFEICLPGLLLYFQAPSGGPSLSGHAADDSQHFGADGRFCRPPAWGSSVVRHLALAQPPAVLVCQQAELPTRSGTPRSRVSKWLHRLHTRQQSHRPGCVLA